MDKDGEIVQKDPAKDLPSLDRVEERLENIVPRSRVPDKLEDVRPNRRVL